MCSNLSHVVSTAVPHLETLLLLWESPDLTWNEQDVAARVYVNREQARSILLDLFKHGLIAHTDSLSEHYRYDAGWDVANLMPRVAASYRRHLTYVAGVIHAKASSGSGPAVCPRI